ncbi:hypothetical protein AMS68_001225 [Peltaster fructicola]|uniref:UNC-45/Cro1/She4 central domain-containing protein n=1 Tax=Peltaster fructicola TaxID=286661 RepID=A0A6H0XM61_9PEZI|nr:hypothetical protein AMS68_001225 [Peltaster fructicola]
MAVPMDLDDREHDDQVALILAQDIDEESYLATLQSVADRSREDLAIRSRIGRADVLEALVQRLGALPAAHYNLAYEQQTLRCIGNACAMNQDAIRTVSALGMEWFTRYTMQACPQELQALASAVLYNITAADFSVDGSDEEQENPAFKVCYAAGIHIWLVSRLVNPPVDPPAIEIVEGLIDMLFWISSSATAATEHPLPAQTISQLCRSMQQYCPSSSAETLSTLIESVIALLRPAKAQLAAGTDSFGLFELLASLDQRIAAARADQQESQADDLAVLVPQSSNLTWLLSDISTEPTFAVTSKLQDPLVRSCLLTFVQASSTTKSEQMQIASSLVLGNALLNMPESETVSLLRETTLASIVVDILSQPETSPDLLYAASGLLTMLCRPRETREVIGRLERVVPVVEKLCKHQVPQIRDAGVRLLKALGRDSQLNQERLAAAVQAYGDAQSGQQQQIDAAP